MSCHYNLPGALFPSLQSWQQSRSASSPAVRDLGLHQAKKHWPPFAIGWQQSLVSHKLFVEGANMSIQDFEGDMVHSQLHGLCYATRIISDGKMRCTKTIEFVHALL